MEQASINTNLAKSEEYGIRSLYFKYIQSLHKNPWTIEGVSPHILHFQSIDKYLNTEYWTYEYLINILPYTKLSHQQFLQNVYEESMPRPIEEKQIYIEAFGNALYRLGFNSSITPYAKKSIAKQLSEISQDLYVGQHSIYERQILEATKEMNYQNSKVLERLR